MWHLTLKMQRSISSEDNVKIYKDTKRSAPAIDSPSIKCRLRTHSSSTIKQSTQIEVDVINADTLDAAYLLKTERPWVMNLADNVSPGGCVDVGACSQEECLFRRTNLFKSLVANMYPIRINEAIYSPSITVFKQGENEHYAPLGVSSYKVDFIACPGLRYPKLCEGHLTPNDIETLKNKIRLIFQVCETYGHTTLVAGALGCGEWHNPPADVAQVFKQIISEHAAHGTTVNRIVFAILRPKGVYNPNLNNDNLQVFKQILCSWWVALLWICFYTL